jgi:hypothetical protein
MRKEKGVSGWQLGDAALPYQHWKKGGSCNQIGTCLLQSDTRKGHWAIIFGTPGNKAWKSQVGKCFENDTFRGRY